MKHSLAKAARHRQKVKRRRSDNAWIYRGLALVALLAMVAALPGRLVSMRKIRAFSLSGRNQEQAVAARSEQPPPVEPVAARPLYPYSIIAGGAYDREELSRAIANDPVVARHYAAFHVNLVRVVRLAQDQSLYASYRIGDQTYWTKRKITVRKGETVLTDGEHTARARCGNLLSSLPQQPVSPTEPRETTMDTPPNPVLVAENIAPGHLVIAPIADPPQGLEPPVLETPTSGPALAGAPAVMIPPVFFPPVGITGNLPPPGGPPIATPEPSVLVELGLGLTALLFFLPLDRAFRRSPAEPAKRNKPGTGARGGASWLPIRVPGPCEQPAKRFEKI